NVIFQAGVDFESKPMVVFCSCNLPKEVDLDRLLNLIIFRLDEFVESDYTVVMFTSGAQYNPGWHWLSKAYRRLDRKYRKNVKNVYVVHPSMWSKLIFQIFGKIVSPKFFAKVTWVDTLSQLAGLVPLNQINVPQPVYDASSQAKSSRNRATTHSQPAEQPASLESQVFGVPLETLVTNATAGMLPRPLRECISYIRHNGLATEGLFRRSPPSTALRAAKDSYNRGQHVDLDLAGVHVAAVLLKLFFRELPTPVFGTQNSYEIVRALPLAGKTAPQEEGDTVDAVSEQMDNVRARYVEEVVLGSLDKACRLVLCFTFALLGVVSRHEEDNRMSAYNLAIVWAPNLARSD
ncbi:Rho GTPase activation protein, partial [Coemansia spiralis]